MTISYRFLILKCYMRKHRISYCLFLSTEIILFHSKKKQLAYSQQKLR